MARNAPLSLPRVFALQERGSRLSAQGSRGPTARCTRRNAQHGPAPLREFKYAGCLQRQRFSAYSTPGPQNTGGESLPAAPPSWSSQPSAQPTAPRSAGSCRCAPAGCGGAPDAGGTAARHNGRISLSSAHLPLPLFSPLTLQRPEIPCSWSPAAHQSCERAAEKNNVQLWIWQNPPRRVAL